MNSDEMSVFLYTQLPWQLQKIRSKFLFLQITFQK
jgi:hypothetical protein